MEDTKLKIKTTEAQIKAIKKYAQNNKDKIKEITNRYNLKNRDKLNLMSNKNYHTHKQDEEWLMKRRIKSREAMREYRKRKKENNIE